MPLAREVVEAVGLKNVVSLEEAVECLAGCKPKKAAQFGLGKPSTLVFFEHEGLECATRQVAAGSLEPLSQSSGMSTVTCRASGT
jgi:hypothetical protein